MATLADNNVYLKIDGVVVNAFFKEVTPSGSSAGIDTTHGSGTDWTEESPGLKSMSFDITLTYDVELVQTYIQHIAKGQVVEIEYGPESNVSGKPRHVQNFHIESNKHTVSHDKSEVTFEITANNHGAPSIDMDAGGVYS